METAVFFVQYSSDRINLITYYFCQIYLVLVRLVWHTHTHRDEGLANNFDHCIHCS